MLRRYCGSCKSIKIFTYDRRTSTGTCSCGQTISVSDPLS